MKHLDFAGRTLLSFVSFNLGWWVCALGASYGYSWAGPALVPLWVGLHLYFSPTRLGEFLFFVVLAVFGFALDTLLIKLGLFSISPASAYAPAWLVAMWILLGITFESMLLVRRRLSLLLLSGALSGPISYFAGEAMNILFYVRPLWLSLVIHAVIWALLMPVLFKFRDWSIEVSLLGRRR